MIHVLPFITFGKVVKNVRDGVPLLSIRKISRHRRYIGRIEAPAKLRSCPEVRPHPAPYRLLEYLPKLIHIPLFIIISADLLRLERPVFPDLRSSAIGRNDMPRLQSFDIMIDRDLSVALGITREILKQPDLINSLLDGRMLEEGLDLRGDQKQPLFRNVRVVDRSNPEVIARKKQAPLAPIPHRKRKHAKEILETGISPALVSRKDNP